MPTYAQSLERIKEQLAQQLQQQQKAHQQELAEQLHQQELLFDDRFDKVVGQYYEARAEFERMRQQCAQLQAKLEAQQQTITDAQHLVTLKQEAIAHLLPAYPHPITPELQYRIQAA